MNNSQKCVLDILKYSLFSGDKPSFEGLDYISLYKEMRDQTVLGFSNDLLETINLDDSIKEIWMKSLAIDIFQFYSILDEQQELIKLLEQNNLQSCVLKGTAAAKYYPNPEYRKSGDIDIIVTPDAFQSANEILLNNGYVLIDETDPRHNVFTKNGVEIELHRIFSYVKYEEGKVLDELIFNNIYNKVCTDIEGYTYYSLPDSINGLILLMHLNEHLKYGVGLRHLLDWIMFANQLLTDTYWENEFKSLAQSVGLEKLAMIATRTGQIYIGLPEKNRRWCLSADSETCSELIEYILSSGNFGSKINDKNEVKELALNVKKAGNVFKYLQEAGSRNWGAVNRYPYLKHFAWTYQILKYFKQLVSYRHPIKELMSKRNNYNEQKELLKSFGVTQLPND